MPINALQLANSVRYKTLAERQDEASQRKLNALQMAEAEMGLEEARDTRQSRNVLRNLAKSGLSGEELAQQYQMQTGDYGTAQGIRDKARALTKSEAEAGEAMLDMLPKLADVSQESWPVFRQSFERFAKLAGADTEGLPQEWGPEAEQLVMEARTNLEPIVQQIGGYDFLRSGTRSDPEYKQITQPKAPTLKEVYDPNSPTGTRYVTAEEAIGRPGKGSGEDLREKKIVEWMISEGIAGDPKDAWSKYKTAVASPMTFAQNMAKAELGDWPEEEALGKLEERVRYWHDVAKQMQGGEAGGGHAGQAPPPARLPPREEREIGAVYDTPRGKMMWIGEGWVDPSTVAPDSPALPRAAAPEEEEETPGGGPQQAPSRATPGTNRRPTLTLESVDPAQAELADRAPGARNVREAYDAVAGTLADRFAPFEQGVRNVEALRKRIAQGGPIQPTTQQLIRVLNQQSDDDLIAYGMTAKEVRVLRGLAKRLL